MGVLLSIPTAGRAAACPAALLEGMPTGAGGSGREPEFLRQQCPKGADLCSHPTGAKGHWHTGLTMDGLFQGCSSTWKKDQREEKTDQTGAATMPEVRKCSCTLLVLTKTKRWVSGMGSKKFFTWFVFLWVPVATSF